MKRYDSNDSLYEKVVDMMSLLKAVGWLSLIMMLFLQFAGLSKVYKLMKFLKDTFDEDYLTVFWGAFCVGIFLFVIILIRDIDSKLVDCNSTSDFDYKELYIGVYATWLIGFLGALLFSKDIEFPVPTFTRAFQMLGMTNTKLYHIIMFVFQSLMIWLIFCLMQLLTLHFIFFMVALPVKPLVVIVSLVCVLTFTALAISSTSIMMEVVSLDRINPFRENFLLSYPKDLLYSFASLLLPAFILTMMFFAYQFGDKLGPTLNVTDTSMAIIGSAVSTAFLALSFFLRNTTLRELMIPSKNKKEKGMKEEGDAKSDTHKFVDGDYGAPSKGYIAINDD